MNEKLTLRSRILITLLVTLLIWGHLAWDYFHAGIPVHYILQSDSLPGISNLWGGLMLPFFTWFLLYRIQKRIARPAAEDGLQKVMRRFVVAVVVAAGISICFSLDIEVIDYIMLALFVLSFFLPLYKAEFLLGFVLGSTFTFGAIIPMVFGSVLALIFFLIFQLVRFIIGYVRPKEK